LSQPQAAERSSEQGSADSELEPVLTRLVIKQ
jgi:hypothetical protein